MSQTHIIFIVTVAVLLLVGGVWFVRGSSDEAILSRSGIHWHPRIEIIIGGEKQEIPENIGIGMQYNGMPTYEPSMRMTALHTHEKDGIIHMEFPGRVTESDTQLQNFFRIWEKDPVVFGPLASVTINGKETDRFLEYPMRDGDIIVMKYEN